MSSEILYYKMPGLYRPSELDLMREAALPSADVGSHGARNPFGLSDPVRFRIFAELALGEGRNCTAFVNVNDLPLPKWSLPAIQGSAGVLIRSERNGVELRNYTRCDELKKNTVS